MYYYYYYYDDYYYYYYYYTRVVPSTLSYLFCSSIPMSQ